MKRIGIIFLVILILSIGIVIRSEEMTKNIEKLDRDQKVQLLKDIVKRKSFLNSSSDNKLKKFTIGKFFNMSIYRKLIGNDILGYEYDEGFVNESPTVFIRTIRTNNKTRSFRRSFLMSLNKIVRKKNIRISKMSQIEVGVGLIDVEAKRTLSTLPGALIEVYFENKRSGKRFFYRFGTGRRSGVEDAFDDIWMLLFSVLESFR